MSEERKVEKQFGIEIFTWDGWDEQDTDTLTFYKVQFMFDSMKKFNGCSVDKTFEGKLTIWDEATATEILWQGYVIDIPEFKDLFKLPHTVYMAKVKYPDRFTNPDEIDFDNVGVFTTMELANEAIQKEIEHYSAMHKKMVGDDLDINDIEKRVDELEIVR